MANTYQLSDGTRIKKSVLDSRIAAAKKKFKASFEEDEFTGLTFCQALGKNADETVDNSHIISVDRCQKMGKSELAYDVDNLQRESRSQHDIWAGVSIELRMIQQNFIHKCEYIAKHDPQDFAILALAVRSANDKLYITEQVFIDWENK